MRTERSAVEIWNKVLIASYWWKGVHDGPIVAAQAQGYFLGRAAETTSPELRGDWLTLADLAGGILKFHVLGEKP